MRLILRVLRPLSFTDSLRYTSHQALMEALKSPIPSINGLALNLLKKAKTNPGDAAIVAGMKDLVTELLRLWLSTADVEVAETASTVIVGLLETDFGPSTGGEWMDEPDINTPMDLDAEETGGRGQGLMWRRIFEDKNVYRLLFSLCSLKDVHMTNGPRTKRQASLAQARLLGVLPSLAVIDFDTVCRSHSAEVERSYLHHRYGLGHGEGLLDYAAAHMVDHEGDVLMHTMLISFYEELIRKGATYSAHMTSSCGSIDPHSSPFLDFLIARGLHRRTVNDYLQATADALDANFIFDSAASYVATYASCYPEHLMSSKLEDGGSLAIDQVLDHLWANFGPSSSRSARQNAVSPDLRVLTSLPRVALLLWPNHGPENFSVTGWCNGNPVGQLPNHVPLPGFFVALARVFHGPFQAPSLAEKSSPNYGNRSLDSDAAAARALYLLYVYFHANLYREIVRFAETTALKEVALAAISFITGILTANWAPLPDEASSNPTNLSLPTEAELQRGIHGMGSRTRLPQSGVEAILTSPVRETVLPYLCSPPKTFTNLVGGRGDAESAAYQIAVAKHDALKLLQSGMQRVNFPRGPMTDAVAQAVARGPWGGSGGVGGNIGTLEL